MIRQIRSARRGDTERGVRILVLQLIAQSEVDRSAPSTGEIHAAEPEVIRLVAQRRYGRGRDSETRVP